MLNDTPVEASPFLASPLTEPPAEYDSLERIQERLKELDALWELVEACRQNDHRQHVFAGWKISVVIPVYNERQTVLQIISRVKALPFDKEIVVVDDGSTDGTRGWLETLRDAPGLRLILLDRNHGKGAALRAGFEAAMGDIIVVQDADLEYDPSDLVRVLQPIVAGTADVVFGSRYLAGCGGDRSLLHRLINGSLTWASNRFTGLRLTDMETCHKAFRRDVLQSVPLRQNRFGFEPEVTAKLARRQCRFQEIPIGYQPRGYADGKKIGVLDAFNTIYCIVRYGLAD